MMSRRMKTQEGSRITDRNSHTNRTMMPKEAL
jgi:hypothetical protein